MPANIAINGFGRIGRLVLRSLLQRYKRELTVVAVNDMADLKTNAHLFRYDTSYGIYPGKIELGDNAMKVDGQNIAVLSQRDPARLPWKQLGVDIVIEASGVFTDGAQVRAHLDAGAKKAIVTAPATNEDITLVLGVNDRDYNPRKHHIVSNASCTTNCLAPVAKVLHDHFGIERGLMTTVHSYTNDQRILDLMHKDLRRARAAAMNIVPTSTGAAKAIGLVMPELKGKLHGISLRVPTATVSVVDLVVDLKKAATVEEINGALKSRAEGKMNGVLVFCDEPLVSSDFRGNPASSIVDGLSTVVLEGKMAKVLSWYDNEWGYSCRVADLAKLLVDKGIEEDRTMNAKDIMTRDIVTVSPTLKIKDLAMLLIKNQISGAPVAGKNGKLVGVVSEADIIAKKGKDVKSIMSAKIISVSEDTSVEDIARLMTTHAIKRVPVMKDGALVGIVSRADIVSAIAQGQHVAIHTPIYDL